MGVDEQGNQSRILDSCSVCHTSNDLLQTTRSIETKNLANVSR